MGEEYLSVEAKGWVRWLPTGYGSHEAVRIRFVESEGGRLIAVELRLVDSEGLRADMPRQVPLARIERWVNRPDVREAVLEQQETPNIPRPRTSPKITVPERRGRKSYPDAFYRRVAEVVAADWSARAIAEASGVPSTSVNRWIKGARERGLLAPSRKEGK